MRFDVFVTVNMMIRIFWDAIPCSLLESYHRFEGAICLHLQDTLKMEAPEFSKTLIPFYHTTEYDIPEDSNLLFS
jgi:hypothetical protein